MDVLLHSDDADFAAALPMLGTFARRIYRASLTGDGSDRDPGGVNVTIIDARSDMARARNTCRRLAATAPTVGLVAVLGAAEFGTLDADWNVNDVFAAGAGAAELRARLRLAITRRRNGVDSTLKFGDLTLNPASYTASLDGRRLELTLTEFKLLNYLVRHPGQAFTRPRLMREVWGQECGKRTVDVHVRRLRAKLGADHESMVDTVRGVGYMAVGSASAANSPRYPRRVHDTSRPGSTSR